MSSSAPVPDGPTLYEDDAPPEDNDADNQFGASEPAADASTKPPIVKISAEIIAPAFEAQQAAFAAEHPELKFLSVKFYNELLASYIDKALKFVNGQPTGHGKFDLKTSEFVDGAGFKLAIHISGLDDVNETGDMLTFSLLRIIENALSDLEADPVGERRREYLYDLRELNLELTPEQLEALETGPLGMLFSLLRVEKAHMRMKESILMPQPKTGWWARFRASVKETTEGFFRES